MRGPLGGAVIDNLSRAIAVLDLLKLNARIQGELDPFARTLPEPQGVDSHA